MRWPCGRGTSSLTIVQFVGIISWTHVSSVKPTIVKRQRRRTVVRSHGGSVIMRFISIVSRDGSKRAKFALLTIEIGTSKSMGDKLRLPSSSVLFYQCTLTANALFCLFFFVQVFSKIFAGRERRGRGRLAWLGRLGRLGLGLNWFRDTWRTRYTFDVIRRRIVLLIDHLKFLL